MFLLLQFTIVDAQTFSCGTNDPSDAEIQSYHDAVGFSSSANTVAGGGVVIDYDLPIHFFILTADDGQTLPTDLPVDRFGTTLSEVNDKGYFAGEDFSFNFYLCEVTYINNPNYFSSISFTDLADLLNMYGDDNMINVFVVKSLSPSLNASGIYYGPELDYVNPSLNNGGVFLESGRINSPLTVAHELGHYFGLSHTFANTINGTHSPLVDFSILLAPRDHVPGSSFLYETNGNTQSQSAVDLWLTILGDGCSSNPNVSCNPSNTGDHIADTNADPYDRANVIGQGSLCESGGSHDCQVFFANDILDYDPPFTNIMSYHNKTPYRFSLNQKSLMKTTLLAAPRRAFLIDNNEPVCSDISFSNPYYSRTGLVERIRNNGNNPTDYDQMPNIKMVIRNLTDGFTCTHETDEEGRYSTRIDYCGTPNPISNGVLVDKDIEFGHSANQHLDYLNGVTTMDLLKIYKHILGIELLDSPYKLIAADVNNSASITTFDLIRLRKFILGLDTPDEILDAPAWRFLPKYSLDPVWNFETPFFQDPFLAEWNYLGSTRAYNESATDKSYLGEMNLNLLEEDAAFEATWSFLGIKTGDVNTSASADANDFGFTDPNDIFNLSFSAPDEIVAGQRFTILCKVEGDFNINGYQIPFEFDPEKFKISGFSQGDLPYFALDNFGVESEDKGHIRALWYNQDFTSNVLVNSEAVLFKIDAEATGGFTDIASAIRLDAATIPMEIINNSDLIEKATIKLELVKSKKKHNLKSVFPNPVGSSGVGVEFELSAEKPVTITLTDFYGNTLTHSAVFTQGLHTYMFNDVSSLSNGMITYSVSLEDEINTGYIIKL